MSTVQFAALLAIILVLQSYSATANFTIPFLSPVIGDNACKTDVCGKGDCVTSNSSNFGFECKCHKGWKQARSVDDESFKFQPCIIPNCTLNFHCSQAHAPSSDEQKKANFSFFDPCFWTDCGGGSCNKTSIFTHACLCEEGYYNLFNSTAFPCYRECAMGAECASLGINVFNSSTSSPHPGSTAVDDSNSDASSLIPEVAFSCLVAVMTTFTLVVFKYT